MRLVESSLVEELRIAALIERMTSDFADRAGRQAFGSSRTCAT